MAIRLKEHINPNEELSNLTWDRLVPEKVLYKLLEEIVKDSCASKIVIRRIKFGEKNYIGEHNKDRKDHFAIYYDRKW